MAELGNTVSNRIYEANVMEIIAKRATASSPPPERENWIRAKYIARAFVRIDALNVDEKMQNGEKIGILFIRSLKFTLKLCEWSFVTLDSQDNKD